MSAGGLSSGSSGSDTGAVDRDLVVSKSTTNRQFQTTPVVNGMVVDHAQENVFKEKHDVVTIEKGAPGAPGVSILGINVCGLESKINCFGDMYNNYDILILTETHTDETSECVITNLFKTINYTVFYKHRKSLSVKKSGGIAICVKTILLIKLK